MQRRESELDGGLVLNTDAIMAGSIKDFLPAHQMFIEDRIERLVKKGERGHPLEAWLQWSEKGRPVTPPIACKSFVKNFLEFLQMCLDATQKSLTETSGSATTWIQATDYLYMSAPSGNASYGLLVGTGTNAVAATDTKLQTPITHGTGAGQLQYGSMSVGAPGVSGQDTTMVLARTWTNGTGSTITINEVGLANGDDSGPTNFIQLTRDRVSPGQAVTAGGTKTASLTLKTTT